jgi:hypothetical protein
MNNVFLGRTIKRNGGIGFTVVFNTAEEAQGYKKKIARFIEKDGYVVERHNGYYDKKEG